MLARINCNCSVNSNLLTFVDLEKIGIVVRIRHFKKLENLIALLLNKLASILEMPYCMSWHSRPFKVNPHCQN